MTWLNFGNAGGNMVSEMARLSREGITCAQKYQDAMDEVARLLAALEEIMATTQDGHAHEICRKTLEQKNPEIASLQRAFDDLLDQNARLLVALSNIASSIGR